MTEEQENGKTEEPDFAKATPGKQNKKKEKKVDPKGQRPTTNDQRLNDLEDLLKRTQADFVNYKNRVEAERKDLIKFGATTTVLKIVPVLDNFSLALAHKPPEMEGSSWVTGVEYIKKQLEDILLAEGVEKIETVGQEFNHNIHEGIGFERDETKKDGEIIREVESGYKMGDKVMKPAKVIVTKNN